MTNSRASGISPEFSTTPITDDTEVAGVNGAVMFDHFTLPTTYAYYIITGMTWKNGTVVNGNIKPLVYIANANPPTSDLQQLVATGETIAASGTDAIQRQSLINSQLIKGGTFLSFGINISGATQELRKVNTSTAKMNKALTFTELPPLSNSVTYNTSSEIYLILHYRGIH